MSTPGFFNDVVAAKSVKSDRRTRVLSKHPLHEASPPSFLLQPSRRLVYTTVDLAPHRTVVA
jgi:hypothetical protein